MAQGRTNKSAPPSKDVTGRFNLVTGEDTYAGQNAQNPATSRRILSLIPEINGQLTRELGETLYNPTNLGGPVGAIFQYDYNDNNGNKQTKRFAATATTLWMESGATWVQVGLPVLGGSLTDFPQFVVINNILHFSDGTNNFIFDGPNSAFQIDGFPLPLDAPVSADGGAGAINATIGKFYWFTFADQTNGRVHESTSSLISAVTGALTNKQRTVTPTRGTVNTTANNPAIVGTGTNFLASQVNFALYVNGALFGIVASVTDATHLTLTSGSSVTTVVNGNILLVPQRSTHVHIYASEVDGSKLGQYLTTMAVTANPPSITDNSVFINQAGNTYTQIARPIRNDPAPPSKILEMHKYRLFRRREAKPNFFNYTANEEVLQGNGNGAPWESVPGADVNTLSDIINEQSYPKQSNRIRAMKSHADALYISTEKDTVPLYGQSIDDFAISQLTAFAMGTASRWGMETTSHGLVIFSYDKTIQLYPNANPYWSVIPENVNATDQLQEIGRPLRAKLLTITNLDSVRTLWYKFNKRDWLVVCYQDNTNAYHTFVYDFSTRGWFELQRGFASVAVFEPVAGQKVLVGGGSDGLTYVMDDLSGQFTPNATFPSALFRTALIDFGNATVLHEPEYIEYEVTSPSLGDSITVNFYLDPQDADNPGTPITMDMQPVPDRPFAFRGWFAASQGGTGVICKRLMVEFSVASDGNAGALRGVILQSQPIPELFK